MIYVVLNLIMKKRKNDIFGGMTYLSKEGQEAYDSILDDFFEDTDIQLFDLNIGGNKMRKLSTIQKREKLNEVYAADEIGPGGANHHYKIALLDANGETIDIKLQCGPRKEEGSQHGVIDSDLLEIVRDRLKAFQTGPFASDYNAKALEHIEEALMWLNRRVEDRIERQVLDTYNK